MGHILNQLAGLAALGNLPNQHDLNRATWYKSIHDTKDMLDQVDEVRKTYDDSIVLIN